MSSPISADKKTSAVGKAIISAHKSISHSNRARILAQLLAQKIERAFPAEQTLRCLDVGCGDMGLSKLIGFLLPNTEWSCIDIHVLPEDKKQDPEWARYTTFDGSHIPFEDDSFDVVMFADVLHHTEGKSVQLLSEAGRVGYLTLVKDHFEYSIFSRVALLAMDFVGNWGYGIKLPDRYFDPQQFSEVSERARLFCTDMDVGIELYAHIPILRHLLRPKWQYIAQLKRRN